MEEQKRYEAEVKARFGLDLAYVRGQWVIPESSSHLELRRMMHGMYPDCYHWLWREHDESAILAWENSNLYYRLREGVELPHFLVQDERCALRDNFEECHRLVDEEIVEYILDDEDDMDEEMADIQDPDEELTEDEDEQLGAGVGSSTEVDGVVYYSTQAGYLG